MGSIDFLMNLFCYYFFYKVYKFLHYLFFIIYKRIEKTKLLHELSGTFFINYIKNFAAKKQFIFLQNN